MADTIRGNGVAVVEAALAALVRDPSTLNRTRRRFLVSLPHDTPHSHNSTRSQSPYDANEQQCHDTKECQLRLEWAASLPNNQLSAQVLEEERRLIQAVEQGDFHVPVGTDYYKQAKEAVKERWAEQGIWNDNWNDMAQGRWKHEELFELSSESEHEMPPTGLFSMQTGQRTELRREYKGGDGRAIRKRQFDGTRPFHQFIYQVSKERERVQNMFEVGAGFAFPPDINTQAYDIVKDIWIKRGIWDATWGILPGMSWKHERPLLKEGVQDDSASAQVHPLGLDSRPSPSTTQQQNPKDSAQQPSFARPVGTSRRQAVRFSTAPGLNRGCSVEALSPVGSSKIYKARRTKGPGPEPAGFPRRSRRLQGTKNVIQTSPKSISIPRSPAKPHGVAKRRRAE
ncbi:hypothetical protein QBC40DRAFT_249602 [Triangularia verruculosa]|uniref:Uncharacterized protein n=1 Tax=Triangularia verruculosa TaxID=2587418 RepID=A0AAN6XW96_9PEZI|nr:hypothetical protein QBC40DRAFT_249602 [Triangularia verruculosa]